MGLLIDIENRFGIRSIAQVDMDVRVHRNQSIESLRRMSYVILSVLMRRSEQLGKLALLEGLGHHLHVIKREGADYLCDAEEIHGKERPPMLSISTYQKKYGITNEDAMLIEADSKNPMLMKCFSHLIDASFVKLDLSATKQKGVIKELLDLLEKKLSLKDPDEIIDGLLSREKRLSTNIGHGVAIPHFVTTQVDEIIILMGRSERGIDFNSTLIRHPVHIIFMILSPPTRRDEYLQSLACIVRLLRHKKVLRDFSHVETPEEAVALLKKYEALINLQRQLDLQLLI